MSRPKVIVWFVDSVFTQEVKLYGHCDGFWTHSALLHGAQCSEKSSCSGGIMAEPAIFLHMMGIHSNVVGSLGQDRFALVSCTCNP